jgi:hypothetical protein
MLSATVSRMRALAGQEMRRSMMGVEVVAIGNGGCAAVAGRATSMLTCG